MGHAGRIPLGPHGLLDGTQFLRVTIHSLRALGFDSAAMALELRSALPLHSPLCRQLLAHSMVGEWRECLEAVADLEPSFKAQAGYLIVRQKLLEMCSGAHGHAVSHVVALLELVQLLPLWIWVRDRRLEHLVERASIHQLGRCRYRNAPDQPVSFLEDHDCGTRLMPCIQIMNDHRGTVLCVQFSHNGKYLASSSTDGKAIIWTIYIWHRDMETPVMVLSGHTQAVNCVSWNLAKPHMLASVGDDRGIRIWLAS